MLVDLPSVIFAVVLALSLITKTATQHRDIGAGPQRRRASITRWSQFGVIRLTSAVFLLSAFAALGIATAPSAGAITDMPVVSWYSTSRSYFSPDGDGQNDAKSFSYYVSQPANVTTTVADASGVVVRTLEDGVSRESYGSFEWDGRNAAGATVPDGVYTVRVRTALASTRSTGRPVMRSSSNFRSK